MEDYSKLVNEIVSHPNCDIPFEKIEKISIVPSGHSVYKTSVRVYSSKYAQDAMGGRQPLWNLGCQGVRAGYTAQWEYKGDPIGIIYQK